MGDLSHLLIAQRVREIADCILRGEDLQVHERRMASSYGQTLQNAGEPSVLFTTFCEL